MAAGSGPSREGHAGGRGANGAYMHAFCTLLRASRLLTGSLSSFDSIMRTRACLALAPLLAMLPMSCVTENNPSVPGVDASTSYPEAGGIDVVQPDVTVPDGGVPDVVEDAPGVDSADAAPLPVTVTV